MSNSILFTLPAEDGGNSMSNSFPQTRPEEDEGNAMSNSFSYRRAEEDGGNAMSNSFPYRRAEEDGGNAMSNRFRSTHLHEDGVNVMAHSFLLPLSHAARHAVLDIITMFDLEGTLIDQKIYESKQILLKHLSIAAPMTFRQIIDPRLIGVRPAGNNDNDHKIGVRFMVMDCNDTGYWFNEKSRDNVYAHFYANLHGENFFVHLAGPKASKTPLIQKCDDFLDMRWNSFRGMLEISSNGVHGFEGGASLAAIDRTTVTAFANVTDFVNLMVQQRSADDEGNDDSDESEQGYFGDDRMYPSGYSEEEDLFEDTLSIDLTEMGVSDTVG
jgi:hypothetical protein